GRHFESARSQRRDVSSSVRASCTGGARVEDRAHRGGVSCPTGRLTSAPFEPTVTRTMAGRAPRVYEQIVPHVERTIFEGRLRQGQKLPPERQLARDLKASRVAVREALRTLEL